MSDQEINIAIAEALGWTEVTDNRKFHQCPTGFPPNSEGTLAYVSDYCGDLNAMRKAETGLNEAKYDGFQKHLLEIVSPKTHWSDMAITRIVSATARQRAEAFLRTIGKWKEEA